MNGWKLKKEEKEAAEEKKGKGEERQKKKREKKGENFFKEDACKHKVEEKGKHTVGASIKR